MKRKYRVEFCGFALSDAKKIYEEHRKEYDVWELRDDEWKTINPFEVEDQVDTFYRPLCTRYMDEEEMLLFAEKTLNHDVISIDELFDDGEERVVQHYYQDERMPKKYDRLNNDIKCRCGCTHFSNRKDEHHIPDYFRDRLIERLGDNEEIKLTCKNCGAKYKYTKQLLVYSLMDKQE